MTKTIYYYYLLLLFIYNNNNNKNRESHFIIGKYIYKNYQYIK